MRLLLLFIFCAFVVKLSAQELLCRVNVTYNQNLAEIDPENIKDMEKDIQSFMNDRRWTEHTFGEEERIEVNVTIQITQKKGQNTYAGSIQVQSNRPVFNSNYKSVAFSHLDKDLTFNYAEYETLEFDDNGFTSNLTSVLAFYAYIILGVDYDSFSLKGGTTYYQKAENVATVAQNADGSAGWSAFKDKRNRYWMVNNLLDNTYTGWRECLYQYHRLGLDMMHQNTDKGRAEVLKSLETLEGAYKKNPSGMLFDVFFYAKSKEIVGIFAEGNESEKNRVVDMLKKMNPQNVAEYQSILK